MLVVLKRTWFGPNGVRYRSHPSGTVVPDNLAEALPSDAVKLGRDGKPVEDNKDAERTIARARSSTMNYAIDPDLQQVSEGEAMMKGNNVPQATHTGTLNLDPALGISSRSFKSQGETNVNEDQKDEDEQKPAQPDEQPSNPPKPLSPEEKKVSRSIDLDDGKKGHSKK